MFAKYGALNEIKTEEKRSKVINKMLKKAKKLEGKIAKSKAPVGKKRETKAAKKDKKVVFNE